MNIVEVIFKMRISMHTNNDFQRDLTMKFNADLHQFSVNDHIKIYDACALLYSLIFQ